MGITALTVLLLMPLSFAQAPAHKSRVDPGQEFKIKKGQEVVVRGGTLRIRFRSVLQDSRCPTGVNCVWAGNGEVAIAVARSNQKQVVKRLNTSSDPKEIVYKGFKIKLVALNPYPKVNRRIARKDYEATMVVTKDE